MKKGLWIYLIILVILATVIDFFMLKTNYIFPKTTEGYTFSNDRYWLVSADTPEVDIITASTGYYRLRSDNTILEGEQITGDYYQKTTSLPVGNWIIEENDLSISITVVSEGLVVIVSKPTVGATIGYLIGTFLVGIYLFFVGYSMSR
jgi:hypothetical protein